MSNLYHLLKVYALNIFGINKAIHSGDRKEKIKLTAFSIFMIFIMLYMAFVSFLYSMILSDSLEQANAMRTLPAIMMAVASAISLFTTIYKTNGVLFGFKDYETVMALPIKSSSIVASRLLMLYGLNILFILFIMLPAGVVYCIKVQPSFVFYPVFIITLFLVPLIPIIVATFIGLLISMIASHFRHSSAMNLIFTLLLFVGVMLVSFSSGTIINDFANISALIMSAVGKIYPLAELYTQAVCDYNVRSLLLFCGLSVVAFAVFVLVIGRCFKHLNDLLTARYTISNYKMTSLKVSSPFMALYQKELKRYFSSSLYVLNTAAGMVMLTIASVALLFMGADQLGAVFEIPELSKFLNDIAPLVLSVFVTLSCTSACSISLEGKSLWIIKSLPIDTTTVFMSKAAVNLTILIPPIAVNCVIFAFILKTNVLQTILLFLTPAIFSVFISLAGLIINLLFPNFTWESETVVIKQSIAVLLAMVVGMISIAIPLVLIFAFSLSATYVTLGTSFVFVLLDFALFAYLKSKGTKKFLSL